MLIFNTKGITPSLSKGSGNSPSGSNVCSQTAPTMASVTLAVPCSSNFRIVNALGVSAVTSASVSKAKSTCKPFANSCFLYSLASQSKMASLSGTDGYSMAWAMCTCFPHWATYTGNVQHCVRCPQMSTVLAVSTVTRLTSEL